MTQTPLAPPAPFSERLADLPVPLFATVLGLGGFTLATRTAENALALGPVASPALLWATIAVMALVSLLYLAKLLRHPSAVQAEWQHPVRIAFFPAISISALLIATALPDPTIARPLWLGAVVVQGVFMLSVVASWIGHRAFTPAHLSPAWFIPAVGNVVAPIGGVAFGYVELSWLFFTTGLLFWLVLLTLVFNRLVFHDPLPGRLLPTLVILIAPPAVAFVAWVALTGAVDPFARILLNAGYLFLGIVLTQGGKIVRLPFALSWWALSFPIAALSLASMQYGMLTGSEVHRLIGLGLWGCLGATVAGLVLRTLLAAWRGEICRPE